MATQAPSQVADFWVLMALRDVLGMRPIAAAFPPLPLPAQCRRGRQPKVAELPVLSTATWQLSDEPAAAEALGCAGRGVE